MSLPPLSKAERALASDLRVHVTKLASEIGVRRAVEGDSLHRAEHYLHQQLTAAAPAARVRREALDGAPGNPANLVLDLPGAVAGPLVIVGAHYDSAEGTPGANDNASGTAAALALAARLSKARHALPIRIVLFANEEPPYFQTDAMGSLRHAAGGKARGESVRAMLSLETMGYFSDAEGSQRYPAPVLGLAYPERGDFIAFVDNRASRGLLRETLGALRAHATIPSEGAALPEGLPGAGWSDHWSFWQHGYPALMVTDTAPFRDPSYHRAGDVIGNLDFERLARVVSGLERANLALAAR
jgi:Zn-dependent M28 family amino/carboxypeptidase